MVPAGGWHGGGGAFPLLNFVLAGLGDPSASRWLEARMNAHDQALFLLAGLRTLFAPGGRRGLRPAQYRAGDEPPAPFATTVI